MHIVVDEAVAGATELLGPLGRLTVLPARAVTPDRLRGADALVVRSGVGVGRELLAGTGVRFVGTATAGVDHVDIEWLREAGIEFVWAAGCNARAVGEYVVAALLALGERMGVDWAGRTLGVVGVGHVGRVVAELGGVLGMRVLGCDPPRARAEGGGGFVSLDELLAGADVVSLHVPLTRSGQDATWRMIDARCAGMVRPGAVLINTSRGEVVETGAVISARRGGRLAGLVCDVWSSEPRIDASLMDIADIMTPHIAGYSLEGKLAGTRLVAEGLARWAGLDSSAPSPARSGGAGVTTAHSGTLRTIRVGEADASHALNNCVKSVYDILADDSRLRSAATEGPAGGGSIEKLRRDYPERREFASYQVEVLGPAATAAASFLQRVLRGLGFEVAKAAENTTVRHLQG